MSNPHMDHVFIGVDPGVRGSAVTVGMFAFVKGPLSEREEAMRAIRFPKHTEHGIYTALLLIKAECVGVQLTAILEKTSIRPPTSASRGGVMMAHYGMCKGFLIAADIRTIEVTPAVWTRKLGRTDPKKTPHSVKKRRNLAMAQVLYPDRHIVQETAEAFLLAEYGRRFHQ